MQFNVPWYLLKSFDCISRCTTFLSNRTLSSQEGDSAGELSLLAGRPLWYSLSVHSAAVKVACLELSVLREYFHEMDRVEDLMQIAAEVDRTLYSIVVQQQVCFASKTIAPVRLP